MGVLGVAYPDLQKMRIGEFFIRATAYYDERFENFRLHADVVRLQTLYLVNIQIKKPIDNPEKLWKWAWEKEEDTRTQEEIEAANRQFIENTVKKWQETSSATLK